MQRIIKVTEEKEIIAYLQEKTDYSSKKLKSMIAHHQITIHGKKIKLPYYLKKEEEILLSTEKKISTPFEILYEDDKFLVVNKRSGLLTVGTLKEKEDTLYHQVYSYLHEKREKVFIVHRLDKETSGVVLFAKRESVKNILQKDWNDIVKTRKYVAVVHGNLPKEGCIKSYLKEEKNTFVHSSKIGKLAITRFFLLKNKKDLSLIDIELLTGRKHQIRVHMKENHTPLLGDKKYGIKDSFPRLALHAYELSLEYPLDHQKYVFKTEIPKEFEKLFS